MQLAPTFLKESLLRTNYSYTEENLGCKNSSKNEEPKKPHKLEPHHFRTDFNKHILHEEVIKKPILSCT